MAKKPTAVGCNIFAGGFTLGVRPYFRVLGHLESSSFGSATAARNFPGLPIWNGVETWPAEMSVDFVYSNPPCAIWSTAGSNHGRNLDDPRLQMLYDGFSLLERFRPKVWVWESVTQAWTKGARVPRELIREGERLGYKATALLEDAQHLGVPQRRKRLMLFLSTVELEFPLDPGSYPEPPTTREVLDQVEPDPDLQLRSGEYERELIRLAGPNDKLQQIYDRLHPEPELVKRGSRWVKKGRPGFQRTRLDPDGVAPAAVRGQLIHPTEDRHLAANEYAALCGFPPDYEWVGKGAAGIADQVCRGVCPPVGKFVAKYVARALRRGQPARAHRYFDLRTLPGDVWAFDLEDL